MYPLILCFCGRSLGDIYDVYLKIRNKKFADAGLSKVDPRFIPLTEASNINMEDTFTSLGITMMCCKNHLNSQVEFKSLLYS